MAVNGLRFVLASVSLAAACATSYSNGAYKADVDRVIAEYSSSGKSIPAPTSSEPKPWGVGQWALYESKARNGTLGYQWIRVVAKDTCGIWIEIDATSYRDHHKWRMCLRSDEGRSTSVNGDALAPLCYPGLGRIAA